MNFIVKQKIMAFGKQYRVFDSADMQVYELNSMLFSPERRKELADMSGAVVAWAEWPLMTGQADLNAGAANGTLEIPFVSLSPEWTGTLNGASLAVRGDFMRLSFSVYVGSQCAATIDKRLLAFSDTYEVDVSDTLLRPEIALLLVALIDHKYHSEEGR